MEVGKRRASHGRAEGIGARDEKHLVATSRTFPVGTTRMPSQGTSSRAMAWERSLACALCRADWWLGDALPEPIGVGLIRSGGGPADRASIGAVLRIRRRRPPRLAVSQGRYAGRLGSSAVSARSAASFVVQLYRHAHVRFDKRVLRRSIHGPLEVQAVRGADVTDRKSVV